MDLVTAVGNFELYVMPALTGILLILFGTWQSVVQLRCNKCRKWKRQVEVVSWLEWEKKVCRGLFADPSYRNCRRTVCAACGHQEVTKEWRTHYEKGPAGPVKNSIMFYFDDGPASKEADEALRDTGYLIKRINAPFEPGRGVPIALYRGTRYAGLEKIQTLCREIEMENKLYGFYGQM